MTNRFKWTTLSFLVLVISAIPFSQTLSTTFFGPVAFVRATGTPVTEVRQFSIAGFQGPYTLHLRNGNEDGTERVASAQVRLNGDLLFGPSDFGQQVWALDAVVELVEPSTLEVRLAGAPGGKVQISIEGTYVDPYAFQEVVVDPAGGEYYFWNGIVLEVPPGAVDQPTSVWTRLLETGQVDETLQAYGEVPKHCLAAFEALPHAFAFNLPVTARLQALPLPTLNSMPMHFTVDLDHQIYNYARTDLVFDRSANMAEFQLSEFSSHAVVAAELTDQPDWDDHSDCSTIETACRCMTFHVEESSLDEVIEGECTRVIVNGSIQYLDCTGAPPETWKLEEYDRGYIAVTPPEPIKTGDVYKFTASVVNSSGEDVGGYSLRFSSLTPAIVEVLDEYSGLVRALKCGEGRIKIEAGCGLEQVVIVDVWSPIASVAIEPPTATMGFYEEIVLTALPQDDEGALVTLDPVVWTSDKPDVVSIEGTGLAVTAVSHGIAGDVRITAQAGCAFIPAGECYIKVQAEVPPAVATVEISPEVEAVRIGELKPLVATVKDAEGNLILGLPVTWASADPAIAAVDAIGMATGVSGGWAWVAATCGGVTGWALVGVPTFGSTYVETWKISGLVNNDYEINGINNKGAFLLEIPLDLQRS